MFRRGRSRNGKRLAYCRRRSLGGRRGTFARFSFGLKPAARLRLSGPQFARRGKTLALAGELAGARSIVETDRNSGTEETLRPVFRSRLGKMRTEAGHGPPAVVGFSPQRPRDFQKTVQG